jgi:hypothetical protein
LYDERFAHQLQYKINKMKLNRSCVSFLLVLLSGKGECFHNCCKNTVRQGSIFSLSANDVPSIPKDIPTLSDIFKSNQKSTNDLKDLKDLDKKRLRKRIRYNDTDGANVPWKATYETSLKTQELLQLASKGKGSPMDRAIRILKTFVETPPEYCNPVNVVYALTLSAKVVKGQNDQFRKLLNQTFDILHQLILSKRLNSRQLANSCWVIAKHYTMDNTILPPNFNDQLSYTQNNGGYSRSEKWNFDEDLAGKQLLLTLDEIADQLIEILQERSDPSMKPLNAIESSMTCWAYATLFPRKMPAGWAIPPRLWQLEQKQSVAKANNSTITFETRGFENSNEMELSLSNADTLFQSMAVFYDEKLKNQGMEALKEFRMKEIATIMWAFSTSGICTTEFTEDAARFISSLAGEAIRRIYDNKTESGILPRDLTEIAWSLGVMQSDNHFLSNELESLIQAIVSSRTSKDGTGVSLDGWTGADCVQMAIALAHGRIDQQNLLIALYSKGLESLRDKSNQWRNDFHLQDWELVVLLWVQARLYLTENIDNVFKDFAKEVPKHLLSCELKLGHQEQANLAWALTVLEQHDNEDAARLLKQIFSSFSASVANGDPIQVEHAHQLWQSFFILKDTCPSVVVDVNPEVQKFLSTMWKREKQRNKSSSARHRALSETLNFMGVKHINEHVEDIDVAIVLKTDSKWTRDSEFSGDDGISTNRVAVEFDGPTHFTRIKDPPPGQKPDPPRALGHTVLKYRLLKKQGWNIVRIPFYEFDRIPFWASMERQRYVQRRLKTHANIKFSGIDVSEYKAPTPNRKSRYD